MDLAVLLLQSLLSFLAVLQRQLAPVDQAILKSLVVREIRVDLIHRMVLEGPAHHHRQPLPELQYHQQHQDCQESRALLRNDIRVDIQFGVETTFLSGKSWNSW